MTDSLLIMDGLDGPCVDVLEVARRLTNGGHRALTMASLLEIRALSAAVLDLHANLSHGADAMLALDKLIDAPTTNPEDARAAFKFFWSRLFARGYVQHKQQHTDVSHETISHAEGVPSDASRQMHS